MAVQLNISDPCQQNWDNMQPAKDGRHCMACRKTVVDFSNMTDREILDYISNVSGDICGRADRFQLNRKLQENKLRKRFSWRYVWSLIVVLLVSAGRLKAQGKIKVERKVQQISGIVKNAMTGEPVPFASVDISGRGFSTDSAGKFSVKVPQHGATVQISSAGYEGGKFTLNAIYKEEQDFYLSPAAGEMEKVVVIGYGSSRCYSIAGGIGVSVSVSTFEKTVREVNEWLPKKDVVIYPNPIQAGNNVQVALQLKEAGQYRLDLIDASGKVLSMQTINLKEPTYKLSIPTKSTWSAGVYWLRITGRHTKKIYNGKIVLQ